MNPPNHDPDRSGAGSLSDAGSGATREKLEKDVRDAKQEMGTQKREKADSGKHRLAAEADTLSDAIDAAAAKLDDHDREGLARYARDLSNKLASAAGQLEGRSVDELASDAKRLARNNPALFMLGSIAVGFGLSRFFKATAERDHQDDDIASENGVAPSHGSTGATWPGQDTDTARTYTTSTAPSSATGRDMP